jgi:hypothetical protein
MTADDQLDILLSDDLYAEGLLASDVASLWRRLARTEQVGKVARLLASDPDRIRGLAAYADNLAKEHHDSKFRHPHDIAICAALVVLQSSPLSQVQNLVARLSKDARPSLTWVQRMADYCREKFVPSEFGGFPILASPRHSPISWTGVVQWSNPEITARSYEFDGNSMSELIHA